MLPQKCGHSFTLICLNVKNNNKNNLLFLDISFILQLGLTVQLDEF